MIKEDHADGRQEYASTTVVQLPVQQDRINSGAVSKGRATRTIHRSTSQTVLATITTVVQVNDDRDQGVPRNRSSVTSRATNGAAHASSAVSRVSLVPVIDDKLRSALNVSVGDGEGGNDTPVASDSEGSMADEGPTEPFERKGTLSKKDGRTHTRRPSVPLKAK
jgi:hypothetical protein